MKLMHVVMDKLWVWKLEMQQHLLQKDCSIGHTLLMELMYVVMET